VKKKLVINILIAVIFLVLVISIGICITNVINPDLLNGDEYNKIDILYGTWSGNIQNGLYSKVEITESNIIFYSIYANGEEKRCGQMYYAITSQSSDGSIIITETGVRNGLKIKVSLYDKDKSKIVWKNMLASTDKGAILTKEGE
jgi:cell division protein YceG involved in septum cleavage